MKTNILISLKGAVCLILCFAATAVCAKTSRDTLSNKDKAIAILKSLESHDPAGAANINNEKYIQHNLRIGDNKEGFLAFFKSRPADNPVQVIRAFEDGDYVFLHMKYRRNDPLISFDIFRFENGKAVEHWDNLQKEARGNHTMTDGVTAIKDLQKTAENKALVNRYVQDVFVKGHIERIGRYLNGNRFIEHHPSFPDGVSGLKKAFAEQQAKGITFKYTAIHLVLGQGNFCLVTGEADIAGKHCSLSDLFRIENGKIAEHWDTIEEIPAKDTWKNNNGKF